MILGQPLLSEADVTSTYYSPWFPRGGNSAKFSCQVINFNGCTLQISVETKNSEDTDDSADTMDAQLITMSAGFVTTWVPEESNVVWDGAKEMVRFKYEVVGDTEVIGSVWVHFRMLNPSWITN